MADEQPAEPDSTAVRVALWRALHRRVDAPPHVFEDELGLLLAGPDDGWRERPDMDPVATAGFRAAVVTRARFVEDLVAVEAGRGVGQYVVLGAGLDTFAQRRPALADRLRVFEIDRPGPQAWKRRRLDETGLGVSDFLTLVPVDFEAGEDWTRLLAEAGFDPARPAVVVSTGVTPYLTEEATAATLRQVAGLAPGSTLALSFLLPFDTIDAGDREAGQVAEQGARAEQTPFVSFYTPERMLELGRAAGFADVAHVSGGELAARYFSGRGDGLRPSSGEDFLVATV